MIDPTLARRLTLTARRARDSTTERNALIRQAHAAGAGAREIARLVGLTHPSVLNIVKQGERT